MDGITSARQFMGGSNGVWAGMRFAQAIKEGRPISPADLRTLDLLRKDDWIQLDNVLIESAAMRLQGVADLLAAGLTYNLPNGLAKTVLQWETVTDMEGAYVSLDGVTRGRNDRIEFDLAGMPLPITHKDFYLNLRMLEASRAGRGQPLDTTYIGLAGRKISELTEDMLFNGLDKKFLGLSIYGYTTHPDRITISFGTGGAWSGSKTGEQVLADLLSMIAAAKGNRMYGPYWVYVGTGGSQAPSTKLDEDFKSNSDKTIRARLLEVEGVRAIRTVDALAAGNVVLVQATPDVVRMVIGEDLQTVQWDIAGGFQINFKAFQIMVPQIRTDDQGRSGIVHMSA